MWSSLVHFGSILLRPLLIIPYVIVIIFRLFLHILLLVLYAIQYLFAFAQFFTIFILGLCLYFFFLSYLLIQLLLKDGTKRIFRTLFLSALWISSKIYVVRPLRYQNRASESQCIEACTNPKTSKLCDKCNDLVDSSSILTGTSFGLVWPVEHHRHHTPNGLRASARTCHLCYTIFRSISKSSSDYGTGDLSTSDKEVLTIKLWETKPFNGKPQIRIQVTGKFDSEPLAIEEFHYGAHTCTVSTETNSPAIFEWAKVQITACKAGIGGHENCQNYFVPPNERQVLPSRIIDVGQDADSEIYLLETCEIDRSLPLDYIAFSHCWGQSNPRPTLLVRNSEAQPPTDSLYFHYRYTPDESRPHLIASDFEESKSPLSIHKLSKNIQHAITIMRGIGFRYLWIDSLCIIQDSEEDKKQELKNMGLIYANAICTISATASADATGGCFFENDPFLGECHLRTNGGLSLIATFPGREETALGKLFQEKVEQAPLTTRAWTFQERVLASRVLHFCEGTVLFECNKLQAASCYSYSMPYPRKKHVQTDGKLVRPLGPPQPPAPPRQPLPTIRLLPSLPSLVSPPSLSLPKFPQLKRRDTPSYLPISRHMHEPSSITDLIPFEFPTLPILPLTSYIPSFSTYIQTYHAFKTYASWRPTTLDIPSPIKSARIGMRGEFEMLATFLGTTPQEKLQFHESWYELVSRYSVRNLSGGGEDKVFAIEGIASFIKRSGSGEGRNRDLTFVAGLWKEFLKENLLWVVDGRRVRPGRAQPTWSWASVDGRIASRPESRTRGLREEEKRSLLQKQTAKGWKESSKKSSETAWEVINALISDEDIQPDNALKLRGKLLKFGLQKIYFYPDVDSHEPLDELYCLPILSLQSRICFGFRERYQLRGIVLRQEPHRDDGVYQRVGYFWTKQRSLEERAVKVASKWIRVT